MLDMVAGTTCHTGAAISVLLPYTHFSAEDQVSVLIKQCHTTYLGQLTMKSNGEDHCQCPVVKKT